MFRGKEISAKEALELGLINSIFPKDDFENSCIAEAKNYCNLNTYALKLTKKLSTYFRDELEKYFNLESAYVE